MRKNKVKRIKPTRGLQGDNPRNEVAGCPTALDTEQAQAPQREGGGGAPGTGSVHAKSKKDKS